MFRTCPTCNGDGLLYELPGEPFCSTCDGTGDVLPDGSRGHALSHGDPSIGDRRGFKTGDIVSLKNRDSHNVGTITEETRYRPTDGKGPVFHFHGDHLSATAACTVRPHEIEHCDKWGGRRPRSPSPHPGRGGEAVSTRIPSIGPGAATTYPLGAWSRLPQIDLRQVWQIVGGAVDKHMEAHPLWKVFCLIYLEGLAHGSQAAQAAHQGKTE